MTLPSNPEGAPARSLALVTACVSLTTTDGGAASLYVRGERFGTVCATDETAVRLEQVQSVLGEGPSVDAVRGLAPVLVPDLDDRSAEGDRWSAFGAEAGAMQVRAVFALPLRIGRVAIGVMDLYRRIPGGMGPGALRAALTTSDLLAQTLLGPDPEAPALEGEASGGAYRLEVHAAAGMVMVHLGVGIEEAMVRLRARAFAGGEPLEVLAAQVIAGTARLDEEDA